ncbi:MAG: hypothetical protein AB1556_14115 [Bacillota bacterium]
MNDEREKVLAAFQDRKVIARLTVCRDGMLAGMESAVKKAEELGLTVEKVLISGELVRVGESILIASGTPWQIVQAEDNLIGLISKCSGVATAAYQARAAAGNKFTVVSGAWKKMPPEIRTQLREAVKIAGVQPRIASGDLIYLDKNIVRCLGGVSETLARFSSISGKIKAIQIRGDFKAIHVEALEAVQGGADILMVDTGCLDDLKRVSCALKGLNVREKVKIAFAGEVDMAKLKRLKGYDVDIVDVGKVIVDAPLLDLKLDVIQR